MIYYNLLEPTIIYHKPLYTLWSPRAFLAPKRNLRGTTVSGTTAGEPTLTRKQALFVWVSRVQGFSLSVLI